MAFRYFSATNLIFRFKISVILLPFMICVSGVSSANFFLPIPDRFGLAAGDGSYRISLHPDVGSPSPPPKSMRNRQNVIFISDALPGAKYEVSIYYTNSTLKNIEVWQGVGYTSPIPPTNLTVNISKNDESAVINWSPPKYCLFSKYLFTLYNLSGQATTPLYNNVSLTKNSTSFPIHNLLPGGSYEARVRTVSQHTQSIFSTSETFASVNFTLKPDPPAKFMVFFRNETTLIIMWHPPPRSTLFTGYKVFIMPSSASESSIFLKKQLDSSIDAPKVMFTDLVPGRPYNIFVQTVSGSEYSSEVVDQYRTTPLPPSSLTYDLNSVTSQSVLIRWKPPKGACEFDAYKISTNDSSMTPVMKFRNESTVYKLSDDVILPGQVYQITLKTVSAKVDSKPISMNVTFRPFPVFNLQSIMNVSVSEWKTRLNNNSISSEWDEESIPYSIKWRVSDQSFQDHFKIAYFEGQIQNGDSNTTTVNSNIRQLNVLLLPGRNYSIVVRAVSHGMESSMARIHQITKPSTPSIDKVTFNETDFSITWQSHVDSRQAYYEVNVTSDDPLIKFETKIVMEAQLSISNLYPGAAYYVKIASVSHGLKSTPQVHRHVVYPRPPDRVAVEKMSNNSLTVRWQAPTNSIFAAFAFSYRIAENPKFRGPTILKSDITWAEIKEAITGERYEIRVSTITHDDVECLHPDVITHTLPPSPVTNIAQFEEGVNSTSINLRFEKPTGRIDYYEIKLFDSADAIKISKNVTRDDYLFSNFLRLNLPNLKPGTEYRLNVTCVSRGLRSAPGHAVTRLRPWITSKMTIVVPDKDLSTTSLTLQYTPTSLTATYFDAYKFQICDSNFTTMYKNRSIVETDDAEIVSFHNLTPGRLYVIKMWTSAVGVLSAQPIEKQQRLDPERVDYIRAKTITNHSIELTWNEPGGEFDDFEVQCSAIEGNMSTIIARPHVIFDTLKPHHQYTFTVVVRSGTQDESPLILRHSKPRSVTFMTDESVPGQIENFRPMHVLPSQIEFAWNLPDGSRNGVLLGYSLTYNLNGSTVDDKNLDITPTQAQVTIGGLEPGQEYTFAIRAETKIGFGPPAQWIQKMPIGAPPQPSSKMVPKVVRKDARSIEIQFGKDFFSEQNGPITGYTVIVAEDTTENVSRRTTLPPWSSATRSIDKWPPYQAVEPFHPFTNDTVANFTIGRDDDCAQLARTYCNGPLKGGSTFYVKIRAFTSPDKYADTGYSLPITTDVNQAFSLKDVVKKQLYANGMYIGMVGFGLIIFSILFCESTIRTRQKRAFNRNDIRRIGKQVIHSTAAVSSPNIMPQQHHPFEKQSGNREQQIPMHLVSHDQYMMLKMKTLLHEDQLDRVGATNSLSHLYAPGKLPSSNTRAGSALNSMGRHGVMVENTRRKPAIKIYQ